VIPSPVKNVRTNVRRDVSIEMREKYRIQYIEKLGKWKFFFSVSHIGHKRLAK